MAVCTALLRGTACSRGALGSAVGVAVAGVVLWSGAAHAANCGDKVGPGGVVVLSGTLNCSQSPGITIEGPVVVSLTDFTLACAPTQDGSAAGTGIAVTGSRARISGGTVEDCSQAVDVGGSGLHRVKHMTVTGTTTGLGDQGIAFHVKSSGNRFADNVIEQYPGEGFRLGDSASNISADHNVVRRNVAQGNANHGFRVQLGQYNTFRRNHALNNTGEGFRTEDAYNRFVRNTGEGNMDEGLRFRGADAQNNVAVGNTFNQNGLSPCRILEEDANPGIAVTDDASNNTIRNNDMDGNCIGIAVEAKSPGNEIVGNTAINSANNFFGIDMLDLSFGCTNNNWSNNTFGVSLPRCI